MFAKVYELVYPFYSVSTRSKIVIFFDRLRRVWSLEKIIDEIDSPIGSMRYELAMNQFKRKTCPSLSFRISAFFDPIRPVWKWEKICDELKPLMISDYRESRAMRQLKRKLPDPITKTQNTF